MTGVFRSQVALPVRRRQLLQSIVGVAVGGATWSLVAGCDRAASPPPVSAIRRVGWLVWGFERGWAGVTAAFRQELTARGWVEGTNLALEARYSDASLDLARTDELVADLLETGVELIVVVAGGYQAVRRATRTLPVVMITTSPDPVGEGLIDSLDRPGGYTTGLTGIPRETATIKLLEVFKETVPTLTQVGILWPRARFGPWQTPDVGATTPEEARVGLHIRRLFEEGAQQFGLTLHPMEIRSHDDYEPAFAAAHAAGVTGVVISFGASPASIQRTAAAANRYVIPLANSWEGWERWSLITYAGNYNTIGQDAARYVDRILRGARPGDLPMERPASYRFWVNLKIADALGLTIPPTILGRATDIIQ